MSSAPQSLADSRERQSAFLEFVFRSRFLNTLAIFAALVAIFAIASPENNFIRPENIQLLLAYAPEVVMIVLGVGLLMVAGEFDLSIGSVLTFCSFVFFWSYTGGLNPFLATVLSVACGGLAGLLNGIITTKGRIISFVATLGTMLFWRAFTVMLSMGSTQSFDLSAHRSFNALFIGKVASWFPVQSLWLIAVAVILSLALHKTKFGNWVFATGNSITAARAMAVRTDAVKIICFTIVGLLVGLTAAMQITRTAVFSPLVGTDLGLKVLAAVVIGGTSIRGGRGNMIGIILGGLIIVVIEDGLSLSRVAFEWTWIIYGLIIMFSVSVEILLERLLKRGP